MADTWGDIISRNYSAGRAMADDFVTSRYAKKADQLRSTYEQKAKDEGKQLQDYLPDLESELRTLAAGVGATRRGVTDKGGAALDMGAMGRIREDVSRTGVRSAGALDLAGNHAGAQDSLAKTGFAVGQDHEGSLAHQRQGDRIRDTSGAITPANAATGAPEQYDMAKGAQSQALSAARYGDSDEANKQQDGSATFRMKAGTAILTQLRNVVRSPGGIDENQFVGLVEGAKQYFPEFKNVDLRVKDDHVVIFKGGKASGTVTPDELDQMFSTAIKAPGQAIQDSMAAQIKSVEDTKAAKAGVDEVVLKATVEVIKGIKAAGFSNEAAQSLVAAQKAVSSASGGAMQFKEIGSDPSKFIVEANGKQYIVKTNQPVGGAGSLLSAGGATDDVQVTDLNGTPLPPEVLNKMGLGKGGDATSALIKLSTDLAKAGTDANFKVANEQINMLNSAGAAYGGSQVPQSSGGGNSRAERNNNPGNIEDGAFAKGLPGYAGSDGRFAKFDSPEAGAGAQTKLLESYVSRGFDTVDKIVGRWSPKSDPTNKAGSTDNYASYVAKQLGVDPGQKLTPAQLPALAQAMAQFESGSREGSKAVAALPVGSAATTLPPGANKDAAEQGAVAQSAPTPQTRVPGRRAAVDPASVGKQGSDLQVVRAEYEKKKELLAQFDADNGTQLGFQPGTSRDSPGTTGPINLPPDIAAVRERLIADLSKYRNDMIELTADTRANTAALRKADAGKGQQALYAKYGGSADFFSRAGSGGSR